MCRPICGPSSSRCSAGTQREGRTSPARAALPVPLWRGARRLRQGPCRPARAAFPVWARCASGPAPDGPCPVTPDNCRFTRPAFDAHRGGGLCQQHQRPGRPGAADDRVVSVRPGEPSRGAELRPHVGRMPLPPTERGAGLLLIQAPRSARCSVTSCQPWAGGGSRRLCARALSRDGWTYAGTRPADGTTTTSAARS